MRLFLVLSSIIIFTTCDNTLDLNAEFKDIPIVYGLLSASQENQFIRVERAFLDPELPADQLAVMAEQIYYPSLNVELVKTSTSESFLLRKVDGNEIGLPRAEGAFALDPNTLYTIGTAEMNLQPGQQYELRIDRGENSEPVTAITTIIDTLIITQPTGRLNFDFNTNFRVRWFPRAQDEETTPSVYDVSMVIHFEEVDKNDPDVEKIAKSLEWSLAQNITDENEVMRLGDEFFNFLQNELEVKPGIRRDFKGIDVVVDAGGEEILDYVRVGQANLGITASQEIPFYSNLSEGRGIFSSRNRNVRSRLLLSAPTQDRIQNSELTRDLNFNF
ncbi:hypothetical protein [Portibacter marinus]|uniref:hypothetical protein n=1 Tax=Portibacter marinus TaxID=2898660 RepID=UPI001F2D0CFF|nr:hypothetical protein [Portibacter marinus]